MMTGAVAPDRLSLETSCLLSQLLFQPSPLLAGPASRFLGTGRAQRVPHCQHTLPTPAGAQGSGTDKTLL